MSKRLNHPNTSSASLASGAVLRDALATVLPEAVLGVFVDGVHGYRVRVYHEDTDLGAIVYHARYLHYMERARSDMLRLVDIDQRAAQEQGKGIWVISALSIRYRKPARLGDDLLVISRVTDVRRASLVFNQQIWCGDDILTEGEAIGAFTTPQGRPLRFPSDWYSRFVSIQNQQDSA